MTREEDILCSTKRHPGIVRIKYGARRDGIIIACDVEYILNAGAWSTLSPIVLWRGTVHSGGPYRIENFRVDAKAVATNTVPNGAFRGFGNPQACAAVEIAMDELAERLGRDPIDLRLQNILKKGDRAFTGNVMNFEVNAGRCLEWARQASDWDRKRAQFAAQPKDLEIRRGLGVACYFHGSGLGGEGTDYANASIRVEGDYTITLQHGMTDYGQGSRTIFTLIAAEALGLAPERIQMLRPDTQTAVESGPTVASRATLVGGNAVRVTAQKLAQTILFAAADLLNCKPEEVRRHHGHYVSPQENEATFEQVIDHAREMGLTLSTQGYWQIPKIHWDFEKGEGVPYFTYAYGAQVAEVEVNQRSGEIKVIKIWASHDAGTIVFPAGAKGQMLGGIAQGLGYALTEGFSYTNGYPDKLSLKQYAIPTALQTPEIELTYLDSIQPEGPFGAKGLAEPTMVATAPAIANAVYQASGQRLRSFPLVLQKKP
jgi:CO/xanthine dehydrogenase Mo-binding subunit